MDLKFPRPLRPGDRIGVTAPSSGVRPAHKARVEVALQALRRRGYDVEVGACMGGDRVVSAPKAERAAELTRMLTDPEIRAVVPPWGGELAIDLLDQLDWDTIGAAEPTWLVGFSDMSTVMLPLTLRTGWATLHGSNLMDTPYVPPTGFVHWTELAAAGEPVTQHAPGRFRSGPYADYEKHPEVTEWELDATGRWSTLDGGGVDVTGRLVGGCVECLGPLTGTPYGDVPAFGKALSDDGLVVYLEVCETTAYDAARAFHCFRLSGWFERANAVLIGRTSAPDSDGFTQRDAVADALGELDVPIVLDVDCGHVAPYLPLVNGALAHVVADDRRNEITQTLG